MRKFLLGVVVLTVALFAARPALVFAEHAEATPGAHGAEATPGSAEAHGSEGGHEEHKGYFEENGGIVKVVALQVIAFVLLFVALKKFAFPVLAKMLSDRADKIRDTYAKLEAEKAELARLTKQAQEKLAGIEREAQARLDAAVQAGTAQRTAILEEATAAAVKILAKAKSEIEVERAKAIEEIRQEMVRLSLDAAERLVKQQLTASKHEELVERFITELDKVKA